jgi:hypothetical protein
MVLSDVEQVGCCHGEDIRVKKHTAKSGQGLGQGRFQEPGVAKSGEAAEPSEFPFVNCLDIVDAQKLEAH